MYYLVYVTWNGEVTFSSFDNLGLVSRRGRKCMEDIRCLAQRTYSNLVYKLVERSEWERYGLVEVE
jgi:hypothetical protein